MSSIGQGLKYAFNPLAGIGDWREYKRKKAEAAYKAKESERLRQIYYDAQEAKQDRMGAVDYQPQLVSSMVGPYKKANAPIAQSVLDGIMLGKSRGGNPWDAPETAARKGLEYDQLLGTPEELQARQKKADSEFGYTVKAPKKVDTTAITMDGNDIRPDAQYDHDTWHKGR